MREGGGDYGVGRKESGKMYPLSRTKSGSQSSPGSGMSSDVVAGAGGGVEPPARPCAPPSPGRGRKGGGVDDTVYVDVNVLKSPEGPFGGGTGGVELASSAGKLDMMRWDGEMVTREVTEGSCRESGGVTSGSGWWVMWLGQTAFVTCTVLYMWLRPKTKHFCGRVVWNLDANMQKFPPPPETWT